MKENKKRLTLRTPYNTLLGHIWDFKRQTSELDKENLMLKSKINCLGESKSKKNTRNSLKARKTVSELKHSGNCSISQQPSKELVEKLEQLKQENYGLKA